MKKLHILGEFFGPYLSQKFTKKEEKFGELNLQLYKTPENTAFGGYVCKKSNIYCDIGYVYFTNIPKEIKFIEITLNNLDNGEIYVYTSKDNKSTERKIVVSVSDEKLTCASLDGINIFCQINNNHYEWPDSTNGMQETIEFLDSKNDQFTSFKVRRGFLRLWGDYDISCLNNKFIF